MSRFPSLALSFLTNSLPPPTDPPPIHRDQQRQRLWAAAAKVIVANHYSERLAEAGIEPSVGSKGDSYDNALAETINGLYKTELIHRRAPWKTRESLELPMLEWLSWFNLIP